jgi:hypothetical protein
MLSMSPIINILSIISLLSLYNYLELSDISKVLAYSTLVKGREEAVWEGVGEDQGAQVIHIVTLHSAINNSHCYYI